ncbi:MAG: hypothetical protein M3Q33_03290 [Acidobacteriota bacterium]|nr:hypothetical protein [Acidobacteriota bacterium]
MKICPSCQKTYSDESLNFCLEDGTVLNKSNESENTLPAETVLMNQPHLTNPNQPAGGQTGEQSGWSNQNKFSMQPPVKSSKSWLWVVGILGGLALLCGGGFIGFVALIANVNDANSNTNRAIENNNRKTPTSTRTPNDRLKVNEIDLSVWVKGDTPLGVTEYKNGELLMDSKKKDYYYVVLGTESDKTENATTKVSVRNINEDDTSLGFGLIVNSDPKPLTQDYAFLIDSENKKYRVVRHQRQKEINEINVIAWTDSSAIKDGTDENVLEIRDENRQMNFYINGQFIVSVKNTDGYSGGVLGLYSGDAVQIAFSKLQTVK